MQNQQNNMTDYNEEYGIELMTATRRLAKVEDEDLPLDAVGVMGFAFTESFSMLTAEADEDEAGQLQMSFQMAADILMNGFISDYEYLIASREEIEDITNRKEFTITFWLDADNSLYANIDSEMVFEQLDEIDAKAETVEMAKLLLELVENRSLGKCALLLHQIKKLMPKG